MDFALLDAPLDEGNLANTSFINRAFYYNYRIYLAADVSG
jgi:hypothetical protein